MKEHIDVLSNSQIKHLVTDEQEPVIALHCSGGNATQWRGFSQMLDAKFDLHTPEHFGTSPEKSWPVERVLSLADEAEPTLKFIDQADKHVHLVGHSYGGALALHIALARPERISSLSLYEPCAFNLLPKLGAGAAAEMSEITAMAALTHRYISDGDMWSAMQGFVDYWNGQGAWLSMKPEHKRKLIEWAPNALNAFDALFAEETQLGVFRHLNVPVQLLMGGCSPKPVQRVSTTLSQLLPNCRMERLAGVGHMGPLTHAETVNRILVEHIQSHSGSSSNGLHKTELAANREAIAA